MKTAAVADVIARIEDEAAQAPGGAVAFDGDGTLWSGDIGEDFFDAALEHGRIDGVARTVLAAEAKAEGIDDGGSGIDIARRIHAAYLAGTFSEERVCEIMTWIYAGWTKDETDRFAGSVFARLQIDARLHAEAITVLRAVRERDVAVFIVSASPRAIVAHAARHLGIDSERVVAATERVDGAGTVEAAVHRPIPYGPGKVTRLRERLGERPLYAAFGDNAFDVSMLREARVPVAIRPKPRLVERAGEVPGLVVLDAMGR